MTFFFKSPRRAALTLSTLFMGQFIATYLLYGAVGLIVTFSVEFILFVLLIIIAR